MKYSWRRVFGPLLVLVIFVGIFAQRTPLLDWFALRNYSPPAEIAGFADRTSLTEYGKHLLYVNKPQLDNRTAFNQHCPNGAEQSVVLGCYTGDRNGIFIYNVTDKQLDGVREVTTAHEMLHQAYDRLTPSKRRQIDTQLQQFAAKLSDQAILEQIASYKKTEPNSLNNEMHSLFGTQIKDLPPALNDYYKQYFVDRTKVVALYDAYRSAFTSRKKQIDAYDAQLAIQKPEIELLQDGLESQLTSLDQMKAQMDARRASGDTAGFNSLVAPYNSKVSAYNSGLEALKQKIETYNDIVNQRNAIADQEQALQRSLSSKSLPDTVE